MNDKQIRELADSALNEACAFIQKQLGIGCGDVASLHFSGYNEQQVLQIFSDYITVELAYKREAEK